MKKKVKDLTLSEVQSFCVKCKTCLDCPLYNLEYDYVCRILPNEYDEDVLNQEVEVEDEYWNSAMCVDEEVYEKMNIPFTKEEKEIIKMLGRM